MSKRKDDEPAVAAGAETAAPPAADPAPAGSEPQISLASGEPAKIPMEQIAVATAVEAPKPTEPPKVIELPKPVEAVMKAVEAMKPAPQPLAEPVTPLAAQPAAAAPTAATEPSRSHKFALLAASVAFAGCMGAMAGALAAAMIARPQASATPLAALDLTSVQDTVAALRSELSSIKSSIDSNSRNSAAQFAKFNERLERIDRVQAAPAAQLKQAMDAIERLERRAQGPAQTAPETTGSVRPQQAAVAPPPEPQRPPVIEGWVVRHVSRGVAVIQGRRVGIIEVETGDVVPGVGRIESIRRQDGRWVVVTSKGLIRSATGPAMLPPMPMPR